MKRTIVGVPIPGEVRSVLEKALGGLEAGQAVAGENMHIAIADMGEQPDWMIDKLITSLSQVEVGPFYVTVTGLETVGGASPTSLHAGVEDPKELKKLHRQVTRVARVDGVDIPHQQFTPGIEIARFGALGPHDMKLILGFCSRRSGMKAGPFPATDFTLWEVREENGKTVHDPIQTYRLRM